MRVFIKDFLSLKELLESFSNEEISKYFSSLITSSDTLSQPTVFIIRLFFKDKDDPSLYYLFSLRNIGSKVRYFKCWLNVNTEDVYDFDPKRDVSTIPELSRFSVIKGVNNKFSFLVIVNPFIKDLFEFFKFRIRLKSPLVLPKGVYFSLFAYDENFFPLPFKIHIKNLEFRE